MHFVTKKTLSRRTFLRAAGASVALPMMDAMIPAFSNSNTNNRTRLVCIEEVHGLPGCSKWGAENHLFAPATVGRGYEMSRSNVLKPLEKWRDYFTIISNTDVKMAEPANPQEAGTDHFRSTAVFLTQSHPEQTKGADISCGTSLDQLHAQKYGSENPLPSLQLSIESNDKNGGCIGACSYTDSLSWTTPATPLPAIHSPRAAFDLLFGTSRITQQRTSRDRTHQSILDWVSEEVADVSKKLGHADRRQIDEYLSRVREVERRIQMVESQNIGRQQRELRGTPPGVPDSFSEHMKLMFDLQVLAFQTDMTRVISFKTGRDASNRIFPESGSGKAFHIASHHGDKPKGVLEFNKICQYRMGQMAHFLTRLQGTKDGESSLLDQTMIIWGSPMGDANLHNHRRCPLVVFGGGNGKLKGGSHIKAEDDTPMANAMLTLLHKLGHDMESFGDSTGTLSL